LIDIKGQKEVSNVANKKIINWMLLIVSLDVVISSRAFWNYLVNSMIDFPSSILLSSTSFEYQVSYAIRLECTYMISICPSLFEKFESMYHLYLNVCSCI
jgi:hypothetical protein